MGIGMDAFFRLGDADFGEGVDGPGEGGLSGDVFVKGERFGDLVAHLHEGIERGHRVLEDHGDAFSTDFAELSLGNGEQVGSFQKRFARMNAAGRLRNEAEEGVAGDGFPRSRFSDDSQGLPFLHGERNVLNGMDYAIAGVETGGEIPDVEKRHGTEAVFRFRDEVGRMECGRGRNRGAGRICPGAA